MAQRLDEKDNSKGKGCSKKCDALSDLENKCQKCFKDAPPMKKGKGKGKSNHISWVCCDHCDKWYHCVCVNVNKNAVPNEYVCYQCLE